MRETMIGLDRWSWTLTRARLRMLLHRRHPTEALVQLRPAAAAIAIQLAPSDVRGMSLLLQAQARMDRCRGLMAAGGP
jgi:hypothetical protein